MSIQLITYNESTVRPVHDAVIQDKALPNNGAFFGCETTKVSSNRLTVSSGIGIIYGREFEITTEDINITLPSSGTLKGRLYVHIDLSNTSEPVQLLSETAANLSTLIDNPDLNINNGICDLELCTFDVGSSDITNIVNTIPTVERANKYVLPTASSSVLGGVKVGSNLSISNGVLSAKNSSTSQAGYMSAADKTKLNGIATGANKYTLPTASDTTLGGVKVGQWMMMVGDKINPTQASNTQAGIIQPSFYKYVTESLTDKTATINKYGYMSAADKTKLDGIQTSAKNIKVSFGSNTWTEVSQGDENLNLTMTVGKPSSGTILACIPVGARTNDNNVNIFIYGVQGSSLANNKAGKFNVQLKGKTTKVLVIGIDVIWLYY